ncbi:ketoacyl-ACP synthase III family protein [Streptomyces sp. NPDC091371]|uniref:ketoacyl-ACP synthase III family protein n=1 Tax=Streptomyces sp. NPDC091371 TaxID=3155303 RepID=UPI0034466478
MRWNDLYIAGTGAFLPKQVTVEEAIDAGLYDEESAGHSGHLALTVAAPEDSIPEMAVRAGRQALARSGYLPEDVAAVTYSVVFHNGIDIWNSGSYIQKGIARAGALAAEVRAGSNGGLIAAELAAAYLYAHPEAKVAVSTAGDLWTDPYFDRWRTDRILYGDGAAAVALSREGGFARVVSMATYTDPDLEAMHRGHEPFGPFQHDAEHPIDLNRRHQQFLETFDKDEVWRRVESGIRKAVDQALEEAGCSIDDMDHIVAPHFGAGLTVRQCLAPIGVHDLSRTAWEFSRRTGHIGPGDQFAGLNHLTETGALTPGRRVLLLGVGGGFSWTGAVLDIVAEPSWRGVPS